MLAIILPSPVRNRPPWLAGAAVCLLGEPTTDELCLGATPCKIHPCRFPSRCRRRRRRRNSGSISQFHLPTAHDQIPGLIDTLLGSSLILKVISFESYWKAIAMPRAKLKPALLVVSRRNRNKASS